uniref:Sugar phosphate exchanger 3 n=1 Tax=Callorhinchus milii TaxID=7868 RepID=A0A4W3H0F0_CALMI
VLTFLCYTSYHLSRKPISIVKVHMWVNCLCPPTLSLSSGMFGERLPLRYYLSVGMLLSGLFTSLFGLGFYWKIHNIWFFVIVQVANGLVQTTGWPSVVTCVGNWFGKGKRGFIMGVWNSHTSVGNILGSLIAGVWVSSAWGLSFIVPGIIIAVMGIVCFFFLVERKYLPPLSGCVVRIQSCGVLRVCRDAAVWSACSHAAVSLLQGVVEFALCLLFAKLVSYTFLFWLPLYLSHVGHLDPKNAGDISTLFDVGGIIGGILAGVVSDYTGGRATTCYVMLITAAPMLFLYNYIGQSGLATVIGMLIVCGALVNGPYALITTAVAADLGTHKCLKGNAKALSTVTAIIDGTGSIGAALGPLLAGFITDWNKVFYMLITSDTLAFLVRSWCRCELALSVDGSPMMVAYDCAIWSQNGWEVAN